MNLLELTGDSSDRLEPLEEIPVELMGFDDGGRLPFGLESGSESIHAQGSSTLPRQRFPGTCCRSSQGAQRSTLPARNARKGSFRVGECAFSQKSPGPGSRSSVAGGLIVPNVLGRSARSLSGPAACARARALLGGGAAPRATRLQMHDQVPATPVRLQAAPPDPPKEAAILGSALLRIACALEQKHDPGGTVQ